MKKFFSLIVLVSAFLFSGSSAVLADIITPVGFVEGSNLPIIIGVGVCCCILLLVIVLVIIALLIKKKDAKPSAPASK